MLFAQRKGQVCQTRRSDRGSYRKHPKRSVNSSFFAGYYRKFVKNFSKIDKPLLKLIPAPKKSSKDKKWLCGDDEQKAFEELKVALTSPPVLGYPDYQTPFEMYVDVSQQEAGRA